MKIVNTINFLVQEGKIPNVGAFEVTETLIQDYYFAYAIVNNKTKGTGTPSNSKLARRLAGTNLLKENIKRGVKSTDIKAGFVYLISNQAFPLHYKIGVTFDILKRLASYQTYSPYRDYKIEKYDFVEDKFKIESQLLNHPLICREQGEWVLVPYAKEIFDDLSRYLVRGKYSRV